MANYLDSNCAPGGKWRNLRVYEVRVRAVWLGHGFFSSIGSLFTGITGNPITHWWVEIETYDDDVWFCAQFGRPTSGKKGKDTLDLRYCRNLSEVTKYGLETANRWGDNPTITNKICKKPPTYTTMGEVYDWMDARNSNYGLFFNNCQDFGNGFSKYFLGKYAHWG